MRLLILIATIYVAIALAIDEEPLLSLEGMQCLSVSCNAPEQFSLLRNYMDQPGYDFLKISHNAVDVLVTADKVEKFKESLKANGINYSVTIEDVQKVVKEEEIALRVQRNLDIGVRSNFASGRLAFTYYPNYTEVLNYLDHVSKFYNVASLIDIGKSYEGRQMKVLKLSSGGANKPAVFIDAGIHAREWISPVTSLYIVDQILTNNTNLLKNVDWYILPVLNPDGYEFTHAQSANRLWRKTRSINKNSMCRGVDGNRNYDISWMSIGASSDPCSETYAGPKAFSEPEMQNMKQFMLARKGQIKVYISLHSYGQYILYPWGYTTKLPSNESELRNLAIRCANAIATTRRTKYTYGTSANHLYPSAGGSDDWAMAKAGVNLSYTYELPGGRYGFVLPPSEIKPVGAETFEAIKEIHRYVTSKYGSGY